MSDSGTAARLRIVGASKRFGGVHALSGVDLEVARGEIHALLGENGAGKSTLMKVLAGAVQPDTGHMEIDGAAYSPEHPGEARARGVAMIYQELNLCPDLTVLENVTLGSEETRAGWIRRGAAQARLRAILEQLGATSFHTRTRVASLGPGERQLVEIARALFSGAKIVVFDEPTSSLSRSDVERLFDVVRGLRSRGVSIVWISHFLDEVDALCDRFTILRDGETVGSGVVRETSNDEILTMMVGRAPEDIYPRGEREAGAPSLRVRGLCTPSGAVEDASFTLRRGEVLGVFGLVGAGRTEMLRALFGLDARSGGRLTLGDEEDVSGFGPGDWLDRGIGLLSEDRAAEGLALDMSLADNASLSVLSGLFSRTSKPERRAAFEIWRDKFAIRSTGGDQPARTLSGGNQQKVAIARLMEHGARVFLLDEPTRGIDVAAKIEVYRWIDELCEDGCAVLMVSSYLPELFGVADRIAVMHRGVLGDARAVAGLTEEDVLREATQGTEVRRAS